MKFEPVHLPPERDLNGAVSATFLKAYNVCRRAAFLYAATKGGATEPQLERGSVFHRILELGTRDVIERGSFYDEDATEEVEYGIPPEVLKAIADEVFADPAYHAPIEEHDYIREACWRWASTARFDPRHVVVEQLVVLELAGWRVRMKIDMLELLEGGAAVKIEDYKSTRHLPSYEDIGRRMRDGRIAAKDLQLVLYALGAAWGVPVLVERDAFGERVERPQPFPLADRAQRFDIAYVFPGIPAEKDNPHSPPARREVSLTRLELVEYRASVEAILSKLSHSVQTGNWPAQQGEGHCGECPAPALCPIPEALRKWAPLIDTDEEAAAEAQAIEVEAKLLNDRRARLRNYVKRQPGQRIRFGRDMVIEPVPQTATEIKDKDGFIAAAEDAAAYGRPFEPHKFIKTRTSTPIRPRRLTEAEMAEKEGAA